MRDGVLRGVHPAPGVDELQGLHALVRRQPEGVEVEVAGRGDRAARGMTNRRANPADRVQNPQSPS